MLLMGDRESESGAALTSGFDSLFGAGRLRMRIFNSAGMDSPWGWGTGTLSVGVGMHTVLLNEGAALPTGVDRLRVVMWWPEPGLDDPSTMGADITMYIQNICGTSIVVSDYSYDTRKRVTMETGAGGRCWALVFDGWIVPANPWEGNSQTRTVYYAYYWEDTARDDADGPLAVVQ